VILKLSTIPELRAEAIRAMTTLQNAGLAVETGTETVTANGSGDGGDAVEHVNITVLPVMHVDLRGPVAAVLRREEPGDVLLWRGPETTSLRTLPPGTRVGIAGARRKAFILEGHVAEFQDPKAWLPSPQQGAVAVLVEKSRVGEIRGPLDHEPTRTAVVCEGALADGLGAWRAPLGALALPSGPWLRLWAMLASPDGTRVVRGDLTGQLSEPEALAERMADYLRARGASELMQG
jgi:porphobilinogen deaminase